MAYDVHPVDETGETRRHHVAILVMVWQTTKLDIGLHVGYDRGNLCLGNEVKIMLHFWKMQLKPEETALPR